MTGNPDKSTGKKGINWRRVAIWAAVDVAAILLTLTVVLNVLVYQYLHPDRITGDADPATYIMPCTNITFQSSDGVRIEGWAIPGSGANSSRNNNTVTVVISHGYGEAKLNRLAEAELLHRLGYNVFMFDYRAHGDSGGDMYRFGAVEWKDLSAACAGAREEFPNTTLGIMGYSMGSLIATEIASDPAQNISFMILISGPSSVPSIARYDYGIVAGPLLFFGSIQAGVDPANLDAVENVKNFNGTILVMAAGKDGTVDPADSRAVFDSFNSTHPGRGLYAMFEDAEHVEQYTDDPFRFESLVGDFLAFTRGG